MRLLDGCKGLMENTCNAWLEINQFVRLTFSQRIFRLPYQQVRQHFERSVRNDRVRWNRIYNSQLRPSRPLRKDALLLVTACISNTVNRADKMTRTPALQCNVVQRLCSRCQFEVYTFCMKTTGPRSVFEKNVHTVDVSFLLTFADKYCVGQTCRHDLLTF